MKSSSLSRSVVLSFLALVSLASAEGMGGQTITEFPLPNANSFPGGIAAVRRQSMVVDLGITYRPYHEAGVVTQFPGRRQGVLLRRSPPAPTGQSGHSRSSRQSYRRTRRGRSLLIHLPTPRAPIDITAAQTKSSGSRFRQPGGSDHDAVVITEITIRRPEDSHPNSGARATAPLVQPKRSYRIGESLRTVVSPNSPSQRRPASCF